MLSLFQDLFVRMLIIVGVFDFIIWWHLVYYNGNGATVLAIFIMEMIVITISLWFDLIYRRKHFKINP